MKTILAYSVVLAFTLIQVIALRIAAAGLSSWVEPEGELTFHVFVGATACILHVFAFVWLFSRYFGQGDWPKNTFLSYALSGIVFSSFTILIALREIDYSQFLGLAGIVSMLGLLSGITVWLLRKAMQA